MSLPEFSVRQVVLVNLLFVIMIVAGLFIVGRIPVDVFPDISFNQALITTPWPGASPDEVERLVTTKIEDEIEDVHGIKELTSFSQSGLSQISVEWDESLSEFEYEAALNELRAALDRVTDLPQEAEEPILRELSTTEIYSICMVAVSDVGDVGEFTLRETTRDLQARLEQIPGVGKASFRGIRDRELHVYVDKDRAYQYDLTLGEISRTIADNNQNVAAGSFTSSTHQEITVRGLGNFLSPNDLSAMIVRKNPDGTHVSLGEVADVVPSFEDRRLFGRYNGDPTILISLSKESDADVVDLVGRVRTYLEGYESRLPEGVEATVTWDTSKFVSTRMGIMASNLLLGLGCVILVLWSTLGFRNALLAILGVPFSFLTALVLFPLFDVTINSLSLVGFIMVSGMLVDHAIIILENIYRRIEEGEEPTNAIVKGTEQVMWPVIATVATTIAAFIPMLLVTGTSGEFMEILPKTVILTLAGSLVEALIVLPAHYYDWGSRHRAKESAESTAPGPLGSFSRWSRRLRIRIDRGLESFRDSYVRAQQRLLVHRYAFLFMCVAALFFTVQLAKHVKTDLFPADFNNLFVTVETPMDYGIEQTDEVMRSAEAVTAGLAHELTDYSTYVGMGMTADMDRVTGVNWGVLYVSFPDTPENLEDPFRVVRLLRDGMEDLREAQPERFENVVVTPPRNGPPVGKPVAIRIQAESYELAKKLAGQMQDELRAMEGVYNVEDNLPLGPRELRVALDRHRASIHGLTFADVGMALRAANEGLVPSTFKDPRSDEDVDIRVLLREEQRSSMADLLDVDVRTPGGYLVKLGDVARIEVERGYQRLYHYDTDRAVVVYADVNTDLTSSDFVNREMQARFAHVPEVYTGVNLVFGGEFEVTKNTFEDMGRAFIIAVIAIYGILAAMFRSYVQPFIVLSVICFAYIGVVIGMFLLDYSLSMYVIYAIVGLAGIVVNDSLVLMDFVNHERSTGTPLWEAVRISSLRRFRPILLTTVTTMAGLAPMALGLSGKSRVFAPFAASIVFGLGFASLLTLFVVPALYLALEDLRAILSRREVEPVRVPVVGGGR